MLAGKGGAMKIKYKIKTLGNCKVHYKEIFLNDIETGKVIVYNEKLEKILKRTFIPNKFNN